MRGESLGLVEDWEDGEGTVGPPGDEDMPAAAAAAAAAAPLDESFDEFERVRERKNVNERFSFGDCRWPDDDAFELIAAGFFTARWSCFFIYIDHLWHKPSLFKELYIDFNRYSCLFAYFLYFIFYLSKLFNYSLLYLRSIK